MSDPGRTIGLDVGDVRIGVAVGDPLGILAQPHDVIQRSSPDQDIGAVVRLVDEFEPVAIVVGIPLNLEGKVGPQAQKVLDFVEALRDAVDIEVVTQDERYSTAAAERSLIQARVRRKKRKQVIDQVAAQHILQGYLDRRARERKARQE